MVYIFKAYKVHSLKSKSLCPSNSKQVFVVNKALSADPIACVILFIVNKQFKKKMFLKACSASKIFKAECNFKIKQFHKKNLKVLVS